MGIVQLPPFANVAAQIMWIDDDLKRRLHLGIGDLKSGQACLVPSANFKQDRHRTGVFLKDVVWGYASYLPRLVTGCLMNALMFDPDSERAFALSFASYMSDRRRPNHSDRKKWAQEAKSRLKLLRDQICDHPARSLPIWKPLADFARYELTYNRSTHGKIVDEIIREPGQDIAKLCTDLGLPPGRNAGAYIAEVISDLQRYIELVDIWPYIVRTLDFLVRNEPSTHWLKEPPLL
jgi:hypothetical protein